MQRCLGREEIIEKGIPVGFTGEFRGMSSQTKDSSGAGAAVRGAEQGNTKKASSSTTSKTTLTLVLIYLIKHALNFIPLFTL